MATPYRNMRNKIDSSRPSLRIGRSETIGIETVSEAKREDYKFTKGLTASGAKTRRQDLLSKFKQVESLFKYYGHSTATWNWIDQGADGACTIVSFLNLLHLTNREELTGKSWKQMGFKKYWQNMYRQFNKYVNAKYNMPELRDYADMLDVGLEQGVELHKNLQEAAGFVYFPVSGLGRETNKNPVLEEGESESKKRYNDFEKKRVLHLIGNHIESRIDRNIPVGLSFNGHARVVVAYNDTHLLFMDGWAPNSDQFVANQRGDGHMDYYIDGFSTVEKFMVYKDCRDLVYFEEAATKPAKKKAGAPTRECESFNYKLKF